MIENKPLSREIISHNQTPQAEKVSAKAIDIPLESSRGDASRYAELYRSTRKLQAAPRNLRVGEGAASLSLAQVRTPGHPPRVSLYSVRLCIARHHGRDQFFWVPRVGSSRGAAHTSSTNVLNVTACLPTARDASAHQQPWPSTEPASCSKLHRCERCALRTYLLYICKP